MPSPTQITTSFGFQTTAAEVIAGIDLTGKRALVTGGAAGIGIETARALASAGAEVTLAVRRPEAAMAVAEEIRQSTGNPHVLVQSLDLANLDSVASFTAWWSGPLHLLVNNAGIMALQQVERTAVGHELQFATNFLGHFALTTGLKAALKAANGARVVSVASSAHLMSPVLFDDPHFNFIPYEPFVAYGQSKTANILFSVALSQKWAADGILSNALNPGAIPTGLQKHTGGMKTPMDKRKTPQEGAATSVFLATSPLLEGIGGRYFENCNEAPLVAKRPMDYSGGVAAYVLDHENAERLWAVALRMIAP